jgi:uncharacterized membrane protein YbhN (UPF0104 family)
MICSIFRGCHPHPEESLLTKKRWKWFAATALMAAVVALAWLGLRNRGFDWAVFWSTTTALNWGWLAASVFFVALSYVGRVLRWAVLMRPVRQRAGMGALLSSTLIGFTAITITSP